MTEHKVKLDRANKSILLRALGDVYYGQRARGGSAEETGRLILRVNDLPAGGKLTMSAAEYRLRAGTPMPWMMLWLGCCAPTRRCLSGKSGYDMGKILVDH